MDIAKVELNFQPIKTIALKITLVAFLICLINLLCIEISMWGHPVVIEQFIVCRFVKAPLHTRIFTKNNVIFSVYRLFFILEIIKN